ncbi:MAG: hypothetical protein KJ674_02530 [Nanoarchaeota archaeon]|nr:hypothetical protein [Nanoarchaeota archaeon]
MSVGKFFCRFFGGILLNLSLTLFLLSFFAGYSIENIGIFESGLKDIVDTDSLLQDYNETEKEQIEMFCELNPDEEGCDIINDPGKAVENEEFKGFINNIKGYASFLINLRVLCIIGFVIGILLVHFAHLNFILTFYKVSLAGLFTSGFAVIYYKFLPDILRKIFNGDVIRNMAQEVPSDMFNKLIEVIISWLTMPLNRTFDLSLLLLGVFVILTVISYIFKRKVLNNKNQKVKNNGKKATDTGRTEKKV